MVFELLEILRSYRKDFSKVEKLRWVSKIVVWSEKAKEKKLEEVAFNFQTCPNNKNFGKVIKELNKAKKKDKYCFSQVFVVYRNDAQKLFKVVYEILDVEGFEPSVFSTEDIAYSGTVLDNIIEKMQSSTHVLIILGVPDDIGEKNKENEIKFLPRPNVVMELGLGIGLLSIKNILVLWDERIERKELSDYEGWPRIYLDSENKWKAALKANLAIWKKSFELFKK